MLKKLLPYTLLFLLGILLGLFLASNTQTDSKVQTSIPIAQQLALAEACQEAAEHLESGIEIQIVNEYLRSTIASQPASGQWGNEINTMLQNAVSADPKVYANNLRLISKGLKQ